MITHSGDHDLGYAQVCAQLTERFGTAFRVEVTGTCATLVAAFEGGIQLVITDCEGPLSPLGHHRDGRAVGFYVGLRRAEPGTENVGEVDVELTYACSQSTPPTAAAIGDLIRAALKRLH
jgi:hypothetical protein